ncbi:methyltransferase domain-containing protein [Candidatus Bathyarchaeota archaeon]|nr:MAG: methyltransferase domain-containing protein [Candidatus Bathyarchaeota archaeon]
MKLYQKVFAVIAYEGMSGLMRRMIRKFYITNEESSNDESSKVREDYERLVSDFNARALAMGYGDIKKYYWYHTVDLGNGLVTPGTYDYRKDLPRFQFPEDMSGMNVLDVGSATDFFAFEFERRGANVISVELPSIEDWDMPHGKDRQLTLENLMAYHQVSTIEEVQYFHLNGPFEFCRKALNSKIRRCHSTIYDLSAQKLGVDAFDLIFVGDVLLHTFSPLRALASLAPLCRGTLIVSSDLANEGYGEPIMRYIGGEERSGDNRSWWIPNRLCLEKMLKRLGFKTVAVVGHHTGVLRPEGHVYDRSIIHATKCEFPLKLCTPSEHHSEVEVSHGQTATHLHTGV